MYTRALFTWIEWDKPEDWQDGDKDFTGFRAKIRGNPTVAEVRARTQCLAELRSGNAPEDDYLKLLAPDVLAWEYQIEDVSGESADVPAPGEAEDNWEAFRLLEPELSHWLTNTVTYAYLPKAATRALQRALTMERQSQNETHPEPVLQTS